MASQGCKSLSQNFAKPSGTRASFQVTSCSSPSSTSDGGDEAFLRRLWHDLYGDQTS